MNPILLNKNNTTKFILPMVLSDDKTYKDILTDNFINAYIADFNKPEYDNMILVVFYEEEEIGGWKEVYIHNNHVIYVFETPKEQEEDFFSSMAGLYSTLTDEYKKRLLQFWEQEEGSDMHCILYKINKKKNDKQVKLEYDINWSRIDELFDRFDLNYEIYDMGARVD